MSCVVADAGPIISLARIDRFSLLHKLYGEILIPARVLAETRVDGDRPGARILRQALATKQIRVVEVDLSSEELLRIPLDLGEMEAIRLAQQQKDLKFLLIDERRGRQYARQLDLPIVGTGGVLLIAKKQGLIDKVGPVLKELAEVGYYLSPRLRREILRLADEIA